MEENKNQQANAQASKGIHPVFAFILVWLSLVVVGYVIGKISSPDFSEKRLVEDYFEKKATYFRYTHDDELRDKKQEMEPPLPAKPSKIIGVASSPRQDAKKAVTKKASKVTNPDTSLISNILKLDSSTIALLLALRSYPAVWVAFDKNIYIYKNEGDSIQIIERNNLEYIPKGNGLLDISKEQFEKYLLPSGALSGVTITRYYSLAEEVAINAGNRKKWVQWAIKILYAFGIGIGYDLGYEGEPNANNIWVEETLHNHRNWKGVIERKVYQYNNQKAKSE